MTRALALVVVGALGAVQLPSPPLDPGEPFRVLADHAIRYFDTSGAAAVACTPPATNCNPDTTSYTLTIDNVLAQTLPASSNTAGTVAFTVSAGLPGGSHAVVVAAAGPSGSAPAATLTVPVTTTQPLPPPSAQGAPTVQRAGTTPPPPPGTIAVGGTTAWVSGTGAATSGALAVPAGNLVVALAAFRSGTSGSLPTVASTPALTWTAVVGASAPNDGNVQVWRATAASGLQALTVTVTAPGIPVAVRTLHVGGVHATQPVGATWTGLSTTNNWTATTYTSTAAGSLGLAVAADFNARGAPTSTDVAAGATIAGSLSYVGVWKASATATVGTAVPFNFDAGGTAGASWRGAAFELRPR